MFLNVNTGRFLAQYSELFSINIVYFIQKWQYFQYFSCLKLFFFKNIAILSIYFHFFTVLSLRFHGQKKRAFSDSFTFSVPLSGLPTYQTRHPH